jgi:hypothetical protein
VVHKNRLGICIVLVALLCGMLPPGNSSAAGAESNMSLHAAIRALQAYGIVDKKPESELRLDDPITRAEFAKVLGSALRDGKTADASKSFPAFTDTNGHWANGWIAVARSRGIFQGRGDGNFYPEAPVTYAEVVTALLRLVGRTEEANRNWPWGAVTAALGFGILPTDFNLEGRIMNDCTRGEVFRMTAIAIGRVSLSGTGKTLLQSLADQTPPSLQLTGFPAQTDRGSLSVSGMATEAVTVSVQGQYADVLPDGSFTVLLQLDPGDNPITVVAMDGAGNRAEAEAHIMYQRLARIEIQPGVIETAVGTPFTASVTRYDETGRAAPTTDISWSYDPSSLSRDAKTGLFKALKSGEFPLRAMLDGFEATARVVSAGPPARIDLQVDRSTLATGSAPTAVHIRVLDDQGRLNTAANPGLSVVTVPDGVVQMDTKAVKVVDGKATVYMVPGQNPGACGLQVVSTGTGTLQSPMIPISVESRRLVAVRLQAVPATLSPRSGQDLAVIATAIDQSGSPIPVTEDVSVALRTSTDSGVKLTSTNALIKKGTASSDYGGQNGTGISTGRIGVSQVAGAYSTLPVLAATVTTKHSEQLTGLDIRMSQDSALADDLSAVLVNVSRLDATGAVVAWDETPLVLFSPSTLVDISQLSDAGGVATFAVRSSVPARVSLTAGVPGRPELNTAPVEVAFVRPSGAYAHPVVKTDIKTVPSGGAIRASVGLLANSSTLAMPNPGPALIYDLTVNGGAVLSQTRVVVPSGATDSEAVTINVPTTYSGSLVITATLVGGRPLAAGLVSVTQVPGKPASSFVGNNLAVIGPGTTRNVVAGEETRFMVQVIKDSQIVKSSFAFGLNVRLNGKLLTTLPDNLHVTLGEKPVTGLAGRTTDGQAEVWVRYTGTGTVELEPVPMAITSLAVDQWGMLGGADTTLKYKVTKDMVTYVAGGMDHLNVSVDPNLGDPLLSVIKGAKGRSAAVRLTPADVFENPSSSGCIASLTRKEGSADGLVIRAGGNFLPAYSLSVPTNGYAEFTVTTTVDGTVASEWIPSAICGLQVLTASNVKVSTTLAVVQTPFIEYLGGDVSGQGLMGASDTALKLRIARLPAVPGPVEVLLYNGTQFLGIFGPIDPSAAEQARRTVSIPKKALGQGPRVLNIQIRLNSGADVSDMSQVSPIYFNATQSQ